MWLEGWERGKEKGGMTGTIGKKTDNRITLPNKEALASVTTCLSNDLPDVNEMWFHSEISVDCSDNDAELKLLITLI